MSQEGRASTVMCRRTCVVRAKRRLPKPNENGAKGVFGPVAEDAAKLFREWIDHRGASVLYRMGVRPSDHPDIVQSACAAYWQTYVLGRRPVSHPHAAMGRIVRNEAIRLWLRNRLFFLPQEDLDRQAPDFTQCVDAVLDFEELLRQFAQEPRTGPTTVEAVRLWVRSGGQQYRVIAEALSTQTAQVRGAVFSFTRWAQRKLDRL